MNFFNNNGGMLTVIVTSTVRPHPGKARLVLSNMKENVEHSVLWV